MASKKYSINNYVIFKYDEEWIEGRITEIQQDKKYTDKKEDRKYNIYVLKNFREMSEPILDGLLHSSTLENMKKFKVQHIRAQTDNLHFPFELKRILEEDKKKILGGCLLKLPAKYPVRRIISDYIKFFAVNRENIQEDELMEVINGFIYYFDNLLGNFLLYKSEKEQHEKFVNEYKTCTVSDVYGCEHLLRLIYALQSKFILECSDTEVKDIIFEYCVYLLDFINMFSKKYLHEKNYEQ